MKLAIIAFVVVLAVLVYDRVLSWRLASTASLRKKIERGDWRYYQGALLELKRRREDISAEALRVISLLSSESRIERTAGEMILKRVYPEFSARIPSYNPAEDAQTCATKAKDVFLRA
jgi:hypothetical protein